MINRLLVLCSVYFYKTQGGGVEDSPDSRHWRDTVLVFWFKQADLYIAATGANKPLAMLVSQY